jgi:hypothetical protein
MNYQQFTVQGRKKRHLPILDAARKNAIKLKGLSTLKIDWFVQ